VSRLPCSLTSQYARTVIDEGFFLTMAGLAMSFVGFTGLMNALRRRDDAWAPMELYQLRIIVAYAIATLFGALLTVPFVDLFGPREGLQWLGLVMLIVSAGLGLGNLVSDIRQGHGIVLPTRVRATFTAITILGLVALAGTALTGAPGIYRIALVLMLAMPAGTFAYVVARIDR
jgi:hypothetical protein